MNATEKPLTKKAQKEAERQEAIEMLRKWVKPGSTVYTVLRHVSASGMSRRITLFVVHRGEAFNITGFAGRAMDWKVNRDELSLVVSGAGMDMGFHAVYTLSRCLFPDGFPVTENCDKCQDRPGFDGLGRECKTCKGTGQKPKRGRNGDMSGHDNDGGYALSHRRPIGRNRGNPVGRLCRP
jgi:hypothetical protein